MSKNFNLQFNNDEEDLLAQGKARFGNTLGRVLKDGLRTALNAPKQNPQQEPQDNGEKIALIFEKFFGDIITEWGELEFLRTAGAQEALRGRFNLLFTKYPKEYIEVETLFRRTFPKLAGLIK